MKILILTPYYPPEVGAPQNRLHSLAKNLKLFGNDVTVLTGMPHYPEMKIHQNYKGKLSYREEIDGIKIVRAWLWVSESGSKISRLMSYLSFAFFASLVGVFKLEKRYDLIISESPPLFIIFPAYTLKKIKKAKLNFNVSDVWPEIGIKFGHLTNKWVIKLFYWLEKISYKHADVITGQTQGIVDSITARFPHKIIHFLPNGYEFDELDIDKVNKYGIREKLKLPADCKIFMYGGLLGHGYEIELIIRAAKELEKENCAFVIVGDGSRKSEFEKYSESLHTQNVFFMGRATVNEMRTFLKDTDALIIPVYKTDLDGIIPSKIFDALAFGKPLLLGVDGEARQKFIDKGKSGIFFEPGNLDQLLSAIKQLLANNELALQLGRNGFEYGRKYFNRRAIAKEYLNFVEQYV